MVMEVFRSKEEILEKRPSAVAMGFFDGLHIGHTELISECVEFAKARGLSPAVFTFRDHPKNVLSGKLLVPRLLTDDEKLSRLKAMGVERVFDFDFADGFHSVAPEVFAKEYIKDSFAAEASFCGFNFHFGEGARGDISLLEAYGKDFGFETHVLEPVSVSGRVVSSTLIRYCINSGDVEPAARLLGRDYALSGIVEKGDGLGRGFGFPTANIAPGSEMTLPARGVYITEAFENGVSYPSVSNVGVKPTIAAGNPVRIETHILGKEVSLYGKTITVAFKKMLREERRFENADALKRQIDKDAEAARGFFLLTR